MALKATLVTFPIGAHLFIRDTSVEAVVTAHEVAIALVRLGWRPTIDRIVDPIEGDEVGVRVLLVRDSDGNDRHALSHALRKAAESLGLEVE